MHVIHFISFFALFYGTLESICPLLIRFRAQSNSCKPLSRQSKVYRADISSHVGPVVLEDTRGRLLLPQPCLEGAGANPGGGR